MKPSYSELLARKVVTPLHASAVFGRRVRTLGGHLGRLLPESGELTGLDVGCGNGTLARALELARPGTTVTGVEVHLRPRTEIPVVAFNGVDLPFSDRSFDFTLLVDVLHHTDDPLPILRECVRVSRRYVLIKDHLCESGFDRVRLRFMDWVGNRGHGVYLPYNYLSARQWDDLFDRVVCAPEMRLARLGLYPPPFTWIFDGTLHFITRLAVPA